MILWMIALAIVVSVSIVGFYQGALRAAFSFIGLLMAASLANPIGNMLDGLIPILGLKNPVTVAFIAPIIAFIVVLALFKFGAFAVHKKVEAWYKYKGSDTERMLWERMNARVGIPMGMANGLIYVLAVCTLIYALGYLTVQVASSENDGWGMKIVNRLSKDLQATGMIKAVEPFMPKAELYYDGADIVADIFHTPLLQNRLANYPPFLLVGEKEEFKPLSDSTFQGDWLKGSLTFAGFASHSQVKPLVDNHDVVTNVLGMLSGDFKDLKTYLTTGKSPKFDEEKILGRWEFDFRASMNAARRMKPNMGSAEITRLMTSLSEYFMKSTVTATVTKQAILHLPSAGSRGTTRGSWKNEYGRYTIILRQGDENIQLEALVDGKTITFTRDGFILVFENTRV